MKQKVLFGISLCSVLILAGCVSEQSYVGSDKPVSDRTFDNIEAARTRISLGLNYLRRGDTSQAKYNLERARSFAPNSAEVYSALAYYYQNVGEPKQAEAYFRQAISKDSNYADAYNNYGAFLCQLKRYDEAEQLLLKAISRPGYIRVAESYENLSMCQLQQNNFTKAKSYLDSSIGHNTTRISSLTMAAALDYAMGDTRQAKAQLDRIQRLGRVSARTVLLSYLIAEKSGDRETMRSAEQLLLTLYTETPETRLLLQGKLQDSEFEQLRERYKDSLMANIVVPDENTNKSEVPAAPQPNPKLKIVKRKTADDVDSLVPAQATADVKPGKDPVLTNAAPAIASSLDVVSQAIVKPAEADVALPAETVVMPKPELAVQTQAEGKADAEVAKVQSESVSDVEVAELPSESVTDVEIAKQQSENTIDVEVAGQQPENAANVEVAEPQATPIANTEPVTELGPEQPKLTEDSVQQIAALPSAEDITAFVEQAAGQETQEQQLTQADGEETVNGENTDLVVADEPNLSVDAVAQSQLALEATIASASESEVNQVTTEQATNTSSVVETAQIEPVTAEQAVSTPFHIVQASESLYSISVQHNIRLQRLMQWNQLAPDSVIKTGQKIWLGPVTEAELAAPMHAEPALKEREQVVAAEPYHTVVAGETMFGISYKYNLRLSSFMQWNNLTESSKLHVGQKVLVVEPDSVAQ